MIALLSLLFPFLKGLLGDGLVERVLAHKRDLAASANERERVQIEAEVRTIEAELDRRSVIKEMQLKEYEHPLLWWPKFLIMMAVALYVLARFTVKTWGLSDFSIAVADLDTWEAGVASAVIGYLFLGGDLRRLFTR